jgi:hypothetical protein
MNSGAGAATNSGINYQQRVSAAFLTLSLIENDISIFLNYQQFQNRKINLLLLEGTDHIDDLVITLDDHHKIYFQIKRTLNLSDSKQSDFYKTIDQFIQQYLNRKSNESYFLVTSSYSSTKVTRELKKLLDSVRLNSTSISSNSLNLSEKNVYEKYEKLVKKLFKHYTKRDMQANEYIEFTKKVYILPFDIEHNSSMEMVISALMKSKVKVNPSMFWELLISNCLRYASQRMSLNRQDIQAIYNDYLIQEAQKKLTDELDAFLIPTFEDANVASGKEVLLCRSNDLFSRIYQDEELANYDYFVIELYRFDDTCNKKVEFTNTQCILSDGVSALEIIFRAATKIGMERYLEDNIEDFTHKSIIFIPAHDIDYVESTMCAKVYSEKIMYMLKNNSKYLQCIECGKAISESNALIVEIDQQQKENKAGLIHQSCRRPTIRVLGTIRSDLFEEYTELNYFDWKLWAKQLMKGQGLFGNKLLNESKQTKIILWNSNIYMNENHDYCIKFHLKDGGFEYILRRGKVDLFNKKEAEKNIAEIRTKIVEYHNENNPLCITAKERIFGPYSMLKNKIDIDDKLYEVIEVSIEKKTQKIPDDYNILENYYTPLFYIQEGEDQEIFSIDGRAVLLNDPFLFESYIENWRTIGIILDSNYEVVIIPDDHNFDNFMHNIYRNQMKAVINPQFDSEGNFINGYMIEKLEDVQQMNENT